MHSLVRRGILALDVDGLINLELARAAIANLSPAKSKAAARLAGLAPAPGAASASTEPPAGASSEPPPGAKDPEAQIGSYHVARALAEKYRALNEKTEYLERIGELVPVDGVRKAAYTAARAARDALAALPARLAARLAAEPTAAACHEILAVEIRRICDELAASPPAPAGEA